MKKIIFLLSFLLSNYCYSQSATLKILGQYSYVEYYKSLGAIIVLEENPNKCDPILGFISLEEQFRHLSESIEVKGSKSKLIPIKDHTYSPYRKQAFRFEEPDAGLFDEVMTVCNNQGAIIKKRYYKLPPHEFIEEDTKAIKALRDAKEKAEELVNHINYEVIQVLNIDDDTRGASKIFEFDDRDPDEIEELMNLLQRFNDLDRREESINSVRSGAYNLWVTFEIRPK